MTETQVSELTAGFFLSCFIGAIAGATFGPAGAVTAFVITLIIAVRESNK